MKMALPDIRMAVGEARDGKKHIVVNLSGEFQTDEEVVAFLRKSGEQLMERSYIVENSANGGD